MDIRPPQRGRGLSLSIAFMGLGLALYLGYDFRQDFVFWWNEVPCIDLSASSSSKLASNNQFASVEGAASASTQYFTRFGQTYEIVALKGTNILVRRDKKDGRLPVRLSAKGRLISDSSIPAYAPAFRFFVERGEAHPVNNQIFVLFDGEMPRKGWKTPAIALGLVMLACLNAVAIIKSLVRMFVSGMR